MKGTKKNCSKEQPKLEEEKTNKALDETTVEVNADPEQGPLDGASAIVNMVKTVFPEDDNGEVEQFQRTAKIMASYELGVCSITDKEDNVMFTVRIDEMMQVLFASAGAYKKMKESGEKPDENEKPL